MKTAMARRHRFSPQNRFNSKMDMGQAMNQCPCGRLGGLAGRIRPDDIGRAVGMPSLRRAVEDRNIGNIDSHRSGKSRMVVEQVMTWPLEEAEGMDEEAATGQGKLKVSERLLASKCYGNSFM
jgi:hypothetical protein